MYIFCLMCCICLKSKNGLKPLHTLPEKQLNCYLKITSEVASQSDGNVSRDCQICEECVGSLYSVCEFIDNCQRGRVVLNARSTAELNQTNSVLVKTEPLSSEDLDSCTIHSILYLKSDREECLHEPEQVIFEDIQQDINIKTEVETDIQENDPLGIPGTSQVCSNNRQTSSVEGIFHDDEDIFKQIDSFTNLNSKKKYPPTNSEKEYKPTKQKQLRTRTGEERRECGTCKKIFNNSRNLKVHMRIHTGEKPYECKMCNKKFNQLSILITHVRTHTGEKPYECKICKSKFSVSSALTRHLRTHTGEKPYECKICKKKFTESPALSRHLRRHTGEKPYECNICEKKFSQSSALKIHLRKHNPE